MAQNDNQQEIKERTDLNCPYWKQRCSEVCEHCVMYLDIKKQGTLGMVNDKRCAIVLDAQKPPVIVQGGPQMGGPHILGAGKN